MSSHTAPPPPGDPRGGSGAYPGQSGPRPSQFRPQLRPALRRPASCPAPSQGRVRPQGLSLAQGCGPLALAAGRHRSFMGGAARTLRPNTFGFRARARTRVCPSQGKSGPSSRHSATSVCSLWWRSPQRSSSAHTPSCPDPAQRCGGALLKESRDRENEAALGRMQPAEGGRACRKIEQRTRLRVPIRLRCAAEPSRGKTGIARTRRRSEACNPQWSGGRAAGSSITPHAFVSRSGSEVRRSPLEENRDRENEAALGGMQPAEGGRACRGFLRAALTSDSPMSPPSTRSSQD